MEEWPPYNSMAKQSRLGGTTLEDLTSSRVMEVDTKKIWANAPGRPIKVKEIVMKCVLMCICCIWSAYVYWLLYCCIVYTSTYTWQYLDVSLFVCGISFEVTVRYCKLLPSNRFFKRLPRSTPISHCSKEASNLAFRWGDRKTLEMKEWNSHCQAQITKSIPWALKSSGLSGARPYSCCDQVPSCFLRAARDLPRGNARVRVSRDNKGWDVQVVVVPESDIDIFYPETYGF